VQKRKLGLPAQGICRFQFARPSSSQFRLNAAQYAGLHPATQASFSAVMTSLGGEDAEHDFVAAQERRRGTTVISRQLSVVRIDFVPCSGDEREEQAAGY
jgi:hypothetical protein